MCSPAPSGVTSTSPGTKPSMSRSALGITSRPALSMVERIPLMLPFNWLEASRAVRGLHRSSAGIPPCREPLQIRFVPAPCLLLAGEERLGLVQDKGVGAAFPPGHVGDGQLGGVDPGVDVLPALLGDRPFEAAPDLVLEEPAQCAAQLAVAAARGQLDRPVAGHALRLGQPGAEPGCAVGGQLTEAG